MPSGAYNFLSRISIPSWVPLSVEASCALSVDLASKKDMSKAEDAKLKQDHAEEDNGDELVSRQSNSKVSEAKEPKPAASIDART